MITYIRNNNKQVPYINEVRVSWHEKQSETLGLRYNTQYGHACDSMTKCNGHAWYDLMYENEICEEGKREGKFWGMKTIIISTSHNKNTMTEN